MMLTGIGWQDAAILSSEVLMAVVLIVLRALTQCCQRFTGVQMWQENTSPCEKALVWDTLHDLVLELLERTVTLPIKSWHVDVKNTKQ